MATVTVFTAERTAEIEATSIVAGEVNSSGHLILTRHDGTPIDVGAVSGMQLDGGTTYSKVDAFTYVGDTDPGAVPDGSVWLDTTDVAGPNSSETQKGLVELATNAETLAGTDNSRAVTPAGLASIPGHKVQILTSNSITEGSAQSAYPLGTSVMSLSTGSGWSLNSEQGILVTENISTLRCIQTFYANTGGTQTARAWVRHYNSSLGGGGWTSWAQVVMMANLDPATFTQTTVFTSYPQGQSRIYYSTVASTGTNWDFATKAGEVLTYRDGSDFARQEWTRHVGGTGATTETERWVRTATSANGWTRWRVIARDAKLPDPTTQRNTGAITISATAWADVTEVATITMNLPYAAIFQVDFGAWISAPVGPATLRAGVSIDGGDPDNLFGAGTFGEVLYDSSQGTQPGAGQHSMTAVGKLAAGSHTFKVRAYRTGADCTLSYPILRVTPVRWAE